MFSNRTGYLCEAVTIDEVRAIDPIPSGFETRRVFRLERRSETGGVQWTLHEAELDRPFRKLYDPGRGAEWVESFGDSANPVDLRFAVARRYDSVDAVITWQPVEWNHTLWLLDIRARESVRRAGAGSALIDYLKDIARSRRVRGINVETQINNFAAVTFYLRHGFEISGFDDHLYANDDLHRQDVALYLFWENPGYDMRRI